MQLGLRMQSIIFLFFHLWKIQVNSGKFDAAAAALL